MPLGGSGDGPPAMTPRAGIGSSADSASQAEAPSLWHTLAGKAPRPFQPPAESASLACGLGRQRVVRRGRS
jgi:hypothetical protein